MEYNQENIRKLARLVVDNWDMDTLGLCYPSPKK